MIVRKYGEEEGGWCSRVLREGYGVGLWKAIRNGWKEFNNRVGFRAGNRRRVRFWKDRWCGEDPLAVAFPELFSISIDREAWVNQMWEQVREGGCWNPLFTRQINDWKLGEVEELLNRLQGQVIKSGVEDVMAWRVTKGGTFTVKSFYYSLVGHSPKGFFVKYYVEPFGHDESQFFCLGSNLGNIFNSRLAKKEGLVSSKQMLFV